MKTLKENIESEVKRTVGYTEASNRTSFMVGVSVAFDKTEKYYERELKILKTQADQYKKSLEALQSDLYILSSIIDRYSNRS